MDLEIEHRDQFLYEPLEFSPLPITVRDLGICDFKQVWALQRELQQELIRGEGREQLLLCEHHDVITLGKSSKQDHLRATPEKLRQLNIETIQIERGGDVTFHGRGQLVVYPIIDLRKRKTAVDWYMRSLEEVIIRSLKSFNINGFRVAGRTGVWTSHTQYDNTQDAKKISSIGVRLSRWCTMHGFSLNVEDVRRGFHLIDPCGMKEVEVTSIREELTSDARAESVTMADVKSVVTDSFCHIFNYRRA